MWAGGKVANFDRIEWKIIPDPATQAAALQQKEVDWVEQPLIDLTPMLRKSPGVKVEVFDKFGALMVIAFNFYHPPFDNVKLRRAVLSAVNQQDYVDCGGRRAVRPRPRRRRRVPARLALCQHRGNGGAHRSARPRQVEAHSRGIRLQGRTDRADGAVRSADLVQADQVTNALYKSLGLNVQFTSWIGAPDAAPQQPEIAGQGRLELLLHRLGGPVGREPVHASAAARQRRGHARLGGARPTSTLRQLRDQWLDAPGPLHAKEDL